MNANCNSRSIDVDQIRRATPYPHILIRRCSAATNSSTSSALLDASAWRDLGAIRAYEFDTSSPGPTPLDDRRLRGSKTLYFAALQAFQVAVATRRHGTSE